MDSGDLWDSVILPWIQQKGRGLPTPIRSGRLLNGKNGLPCKLSAEYTEGYGLEEKLDMEYASRKNNPAGDFLRERKLFPVQKHHLDTNHHVNNCQYIQMAMDYLPVDFKSDRCGLNISSRPGFTTRSVRKSQ